VIRELAPIDQASPQHDPQDRLVLRHRDQLADCGQTSAAYVDGGDAIGSTDAIGVVVRVEGHDGPYAIVEFG
jgi:hypothetical protein